MWLDIYIYYVPSKRTSINRKIVNIPKLVNNRFIKLLLITLLMCVGSLLFSISETAPVIILFSAMYWDSFEIGNSSILKFFIALLAFVSATIILCTLVCIVFFKIGELLPQEYIDELFNCLGYGEEFKKIRGSIIQKTKENKLEKLIFMLRISPILPFQWISVIFGNVMKYTVDTTTYIQYITFSVLGVLICSYTIFINRIY